MFFIPYQRIDDNWIRLSVRYYISIQFSFCWHSFLDGHFHLLRLSIQLKITMDCNPICNRNKSRYDVFELRCFEWTSLEWIAFVARVGEFCWLLTVTFPSYWTQVWILKWNENGKVPGNGYISRDKWNLRTLVNVKKAVYRLKMATIVANCTKQHPTLFIWEVQSLTHNPFCPIKNHLN